jgi:hypothetical protein
MKLHVLAQRVQRSPRTVMRWVDAEPPKYDIPVPTIRDGNLVVWPDVVIERWLHRYRNMIGDPKHARRRTKSTPRRRKPTRR